MNHAEFMTAVCEIYGVYQSPALEKLTYKYIKERWRESDLENMFKQLVLKKSARYKTPPDPAEFEEIFPRGLDTDYEIEANQIWKDLQRYSTRYDAICSDIRVQLAIESTFGSWIGFGQRLEKYEVLNHKNFIENFIKFSKYPVDAQPSLMRGEGNYFDPPPPQMIGDKDKCLALIEENNRAIIGDLTKNIKRTTNIDKTMLRSEPIK